MITLNNSTDKGGGRNISYHDCEREGGGRTSQSLKPNQFWKRGGGQTIYMNVSIKYFAPPPF